MSYCCYRSFTLPRGAMSSSVVFDCGIFVHDRLLFDQTLLDRTKIFFLVSNNFSLAGAIQYFL